MNSIWKAHLHFLIFSHFGPTFRCRNLCFRHIFYHDSYLCNCITSPILEVHLINFSNWKKNIIHTYSQLQPDIVFLNLEPVLRNLSINPSRKKVVRPFHVHNFLKTQSTETYSEPCETSEWERFAKITNNSS